VLKLRTSRAAILLLGGDYCHALSEFDALAGPYARTAGPTCPQALDCLRKPPTAAAHLSTAPTTTTPAKSPTCSPTSGSRAQHVWTRNGRRTGPTSRRWRDASRHGRRSHVVGRSRSAGEARGGQA
jgi:hypothetical protein